ncbi:hypothetical protein AN920_11485 [Pseudomonas paraeruginosa]|nr:hypothetical protein AN920_11485 [Pseudomonas paraeruginosa]
MTREQVAQLLAELQQNVFTTEEAAHYLRLSRQTLELLRLQGGGPRYAKLGRSVRYRRAALDEWLAANEQNHTAESAQ